MFFLGTIETDIWNRYTFEAKNKKLCVKVDNR